MEDVLGANDVYIHAGYWIAITIGNEVHGCQMDNDVWLYFIEDFLHSVSVSDVSPEMNQIELCHVFVATSRQIIDYVQGVTMANKLAA
jgi:hypothetical protein